MCLPVMWNARHVARVVQIQRTAAAMASLSKDAIVDGLLWYQVIVQSQESTVVVSVEDIPSLSPWIREAEIL